MSEPAAVCKTVTDEWGMVHGCGNPVTPLQCDSYLCWGSCSHAQTFWCPICKTFLIEEKEKSGVPPT
jgi:hypothetical protein